jgi:hypothetical protein
MRLRCRLISPFKAFVVYPALKDLFSHDESEKPTRLVAIRHGRWDVVNDGVCLFGTVN